MNKYLKTDPWCIIEEGFNPKNQRASESIFSLGNGRFGQRANFEENYSGKSLQGNYIAGVYYPDKTKVGWWKNGYPEYFAKVLNAPNWIGLDIRIDGEELDLAKCKVSEFRRTLNMKEASLSREFLAEFPSGKRISVKTVRFLSMADQEVAAIRYEISPLNFNGQISVLSYINAAVKNADANYNEFFWDEVSRDVAAESGYIVARTRKTEFDVCTGISTLLKVNGKPAGITPELHEKDKYIACSYKIGLNEGDQLEIEKYACVLSSLYHSKDKIRKNAELVLRNAVRDGFSRLYDAHKAVWADKWEHSDIVIEGDAEAQQGIRFNIFQLNQTYTGDDERLNIGPKGFTGEKYGGSTYWDTEAYCLPFYLSTAPGEVSRKLLLYRYKHLAKAIGNAEKLGFTKGAALYPMVTMNGEECHNEWEITFEEIHRNGAIAHAIFNYIKHTGDRNYLIAFGLEVLIGISRFWQQRVNFSTIRGKYVILGVTGPNEYENNVNNNWYTNKIATWTLSYTLEAIDFVKEQDPDVYKNLVQRLRFGENIETQLWKDIISKMYFPFDEETGVFLQNDGYLDKEQILACELDPAQRPINQRWSWDRILRSCFIKQADVLQGVYLFEDEYDTETIKKNFDFYESRTLHESSLSPCVHSVLAARIGNIGKAYDLYLRTSRLDLDDYNNEVSEGLHITSMAGTWMSVIEGFAGKRVNNDRLILNPMIPAKWSLYSFKLRFRGSLLSIEITAEITRISNLSATRVALLFNGEEVILEGSSEVKLNTTRAQVVQ
jgi:maltose phosphorylase